MTFDDIEKQLPWGLHDAELNRIDIDWRHRRVLLDVRVKMTKRQDVERLGRVEVTGLVFCSVDPPVIDSARGYNAIPTGGLSIDTGSGPGDDAAGAALPNPPPGTFLQWVFVRQWNRFIHICGQEATFSWLDGADGR
jgi:hypothetical protein